MPTTGTLPDLSSEYVLDEGAIARFRANGHVLLRGVASPEEVKAYRPVITAAVDRFNKDRRPLEERDTYARAFLQIENIWVRDELVKKFTMARRFAKIAADLMGVDGVRLYHDQALYKEAHGGFTPWHQDQYYWPLGTSNTITMWMPLVDVPIEMGALTFASTSHRDGSQVAVKISDESEDYFSKLVREKGYPIAQEPLQVGDCTFHYGWTLHHAPGNNTDRMREVMTIIYFADKVNTIIPDNPNRKLDLAAWLPGVSPGEPAASALNPLLYSRP